VKHGELATRSMADIMSRRLDRVADDCEPWVGVYTRARVRALFAGFEGVRIWQRQPDTAFRRLRWLAPIVGRLARSNLIVRATKPRVENESVGRVERPRHRLA